MASIYYGSSPPDLSKDWVLKLNPTVISGGTVFKSTARFGKDGNLGPNTQGCLNAFLFTTFVTLLVNLRGGSWFWGLLKQPS